MAPDPKEFLRRRAALAEAAAPAAGGPLGGTRAERMQRVQVGGFGILAMVLLVGLADAVTSRVQETEAVTVPEAAPTVVASEASAPRDPLADAGVVPELPVENTPTQPVDNTKPPGDLPTTMPTQNAPLQ
ncbi:hypothetical protein [Aurantiacibacter aquimixticola]|uniref:Uncharacterized protein n=1 Tax=Aurantiacibacter aquimixticola TaxID=1958945 RepID=A0A419RTA5_9SPHN|nr:hypothetical protein [Aurantiacibacter aquimixticola]RJY09010.1 hypothetical protein D6201_06215 [Aurantiacibacter aquimixticola]